MLDGTDLMTNLALVYAWTGEKDLAFKQLTAVIQVPGRLSCGQLRLRLYWDPLRGDPRFKKILTSSLAPK